jgi:MerR family copper efflux transcriptional regulator
MDARDAGMDAESTLVPIGEVARRFGAAVSTLRYYDELGILEPADRRGSGRHYGRPELERLALIQMLQAGGLRLDEIAELIAGPGRGRTWQEVLDTRLDELDAQIDRMTAARAALAHMRTCPDADPVRQCPYLAADLDERVAAALGGLDRRREEGSGGAAGAG